MAKIIQPLNDPDDIREEAEEETKEQYAGFYVNQTAPDPLQWQSRAQKAKQQEENKSPEAKAADLSRQNDPLKDQ